MSKKDPTQRIRTATRGVTFREHQDGSRKYSVTWKGGYEPVEGGYEDAVALQAQLRAGVAEKRIKKSDKKTFEEVAKAWLDSKRKLDEDTADAYRDTIDNRLIPAFEGRSIDSITVDDLAGLIISMEKEGLASTSIRKYLQPLSSTLGYAVRKGHRKDNPWLLLTPDDFPDPVEKKDPYDWSDVAAAHLIACARARAARPESRYDWTGLIATTLVCGLRRGESLGLHWKDLTLTGSEPMLHVRQQWKRKRHYADTKTPSSVRDVPLTPETVEMLKALKEKAFANGHASPESPVFATRQGKPLSHRNVSRAFDGSGRTPDSTSCSTTCATTWRRS